MKSWTWVVLLAGLVALGWVALEVRARSLERRWSEFVAKWESKGEAFGVEANLPPLLPDAQEFADHPWVHAVATGDPASVARLEKMKPASVDGYEAWQNLEEENGFLPMMPDELADRVRAHGEEFQSDLAAFAEALGRPGYRVALAKPGRMVGGFTWVKELAAVSKLLDALSQAAIARDDSAEFTRITVLALRAGEKLRGSNSLMGVVVGAGFESVAYQSLERICELRRWPDSELEKWIAALDLRKRPPAEEFAATLRVERGVYLEMILGLEKSPVTRRAISRLPANQRYYFAQARLALCEELEETVLSDGGKPQTSIDPIRWKRFVDDIAARKDEGAADGMGHMFFSSVRGIPESLSSLEGDRATIRARLENELRLMSE